MIKITFFQKDANRLGWVVYNDDKKIGGGITEPDILKSKIRKYRRNGLQVELTNQETGKILLLN